MIWPRNGFWLFLTLAYVKRCEEHKHDIAIFYQPIVNRLCKICSVSTAKKTRVDRSLRPIHQLQLRNARNKAIRMFMHPPGGKTIDVLNWSSKKDVCVGRPNLIGTPTSCRPRFVPVVQERSQLGSCKYLLTEFTCVKNSS